MTVPPPPGGTPPPPPPGGMPPQQPPMPPGPQYAAPPAAPSNGTATGAMICGIVSILCLPLLAGIPAIILGFSGKKKAEELNGVGRGQAITGIILGFISVVEAILIVLFFVFVGFAANEAGKDINEAVKKSNERLDRSGTVADPDSFAITKEETTVGSYGAVTYKAFIENKSDFETGFEIEIKCEGNMGDSGTATAYVYSADDGDKKSIKSTVYLDSETTSADCTYGDVLYSY